MRTRAPLAVPLALATALIGGAALAPAAQAAVDTSRHVVVIGIDGLLFDKIAPANTPNLDAMISAGYSSKTTLYADPMAPTYSGPGWATNLTGVWPDKHQVLGNTWSGSNITSYPDFLTRLEQNDTAYKTYAASTWAPIVNNSAGPALITSAVDSRYASTGDADTATKAAAYLKNTGPNATFLQFDDVDHAGHACGSSCADYTTELEQIDGYIGQLTTAVKARSGYANEKWTYIVTADHGHTPTGGHGGNTDPERSSFIIKSGYGVTAGTPAIQPKNVDIAADVLNAFGVAIPAVLDGQPLATVSTDPFDTKVGSLQARVDETGIPAGVLGWTKSMPTGWSVDNSGMGTGGMTEWRGWSLATDAFWTKTDPGQQRESNVRERGVFAVADSDEWSDKTRTGLFTSSLISQPYTVSGKSSVTLSFGSHYRKEGSETASVQVSFDGGAYSTLFTYTGDTIAKVESRSITVPAGATSMRVAYKLANGDNNWYWAIDNPQVK